jgi:hypothetical protein
LGVGGVGEVKQAAAHGDHVMACNRRMVRGSILQCGCRCHVAGVCNCCGRNPFTAIAGCCSVVLPGRKLNQLPIPLLLQLVVVLQLQYPAPHLRRCTPL